MISLPPLKGRLLIAEPTILNDISFNRSIVLLTEHNNKNTVGFIMNKPLSFTLKDIIPELNFDFKIYQGGPVEQDNLYFIHKIPHLLPNCAEVANGIYWGGNFNSLMEILSLNLVKEDEIRFFLGYSGWDAGQLTEELSKNTWFVVENNFNNIFTTQADSLWKEQLLLIGGKYKIWANAPFDASLN